MSTTSYMLANGETRWYYVFDAPREPGGKRRQITERGFLGQAEAERAEAEARRRTNSLKAHIPGTLAAAFTQWADDREIDLKDTSVGWYRTIVRGYIVPHLGALPTAGLTEAHVNRMSVALLKRGGQRGQGLSSSTVRGVIKTLKAACADMGIALGSDVRMPAAPKIPGRHGPWTAKHSAVFLAAVTDDRIYAAWALALLRGLRRGELAGLRWSHVDLDGAVLYVRSQRTLANGLGVVEDAPKGDSERTLPLGPLLVAILRAWRATWEQENGEAGRRWVGEDYVFTWSRGKVHGKPYHPSYFTHRFPVLCRKAGVPVIALHDARHTTATVGGTAGVDIKAMQAILGHTDPKMLTRVYLHLVDDAGRAAATALERVMMPPTDSAA